MADWRWGSYRRMWQLQGNVELPGGGEGGRWQPVARRRVGLAKRDDGVGYSRPRHSLACILIVCIISQ
jgi:hypothetical protein